uniref:rRNA adenine N(6)-methyltransferase n=1 Tax=Rhizophora mucronata TaxID=61149 RepID=A0A2P2PNA7_RHIMU
MTTLLKRQLLSRWKSYPFHLDQFIFHGYSLGGIRTKPNHHYAGLNHKENEDKFGKRMEDQEGKSRYFYLHKSKGQHLLTNQHVLARIVQKSAINPTDTVLEIGPGTGNLTLRLLKVARKVIAVEVDGRMVEALNKRVSENGLQDRLCVIHEDALKVKFPQVDLVVANIPYNISSCLITKLVYGMAPFRSATLLLQKEFARRLLANPGDSEFNRLAVNVKLVADVEFVMDVSKRDFLPCPKVDSSVVILRPKAEIPNVRLAEWLAFTKMCFSKKNKTLGATFKQKKKVIELLKLFKVKDSSDGKVTANRSNYDSHYDDEGDDKEEIDAEDSRLPICLETELSLFKEKIIEVLKANGFEDKRPSKLSNDELLNLLSFFNKAGIYFHHCTKPKNEGSVTFVVACTS